MPFLHQNQRGPSNSQHVRGCEVLFLLSKNAVSLNASIAVAKELASQKALGGILFALNDNDADGKDVSWIWDSEVEEITSLSENIFITGKRAFEMALCLSCCAKPCTQVQICEDTAKAAFIALNRSSKGKILAVIPTYTAMLELRKALLGRKIL